MYYTASLPHFSLIIQQKKGLDLLQLWKTVPLDLWSLHAPLLMLRRRWQTSASISMSLQ